MPGPDPYDYFSQPASPRQKHYEALRAFFLEKKNAHEIAHAFGYTVSAVYSLTRDFRRQLQQGDDPFFLLKSPGRPPQPVEDDIHTQIVQLRKQYRSVPEIKAVLEANGVKVSSQLINRILTQEGFARLPRRSRRDKNAVPYPSSLSAPESRMLSFQAERFSCESALGILCFLPLIRRYGIDQAIQTSSYPETQSLDRLSSILSILALKLSDVHRYSEDDLWCMDRGLGLFAGLNVLPKTAWFSSYSSRITRQTNVSFLKSLHAIWKREGLLSDSMNLDFTSIPYWGDDAHLENNWSGKRNKALASILAVVAHDPDTGILDYSDATNRHHTQPEVVLEFLDFYRAGKTANDDLNYLIFDSKFTPYRNLYELERRGVKFIAIRRRGKSIVDHLAQIPKSEWKTIRVMGSDGKGRLLKTYEEEVTIKDYEKPVRQLAIAGHGRIQPALLITNDWELSREALVKKYGRRWLVEKAISEQIEFFHLNRVSSSMVIKVDFDLTMTVLAHNLFRLLAMQLDGYSHFTSKSLFDKFLRNGGVIDITPDCIRVNMKKKRHLPALLTAMQSYSDLQYPWLDGKQLHFLGHSSS